MFILYMIRYLKTSTVTMIIIGQLVYKIRNTVIKTQLKFNVWKIFNVERSMNWIEDNEVIIISKRI